jgi:hypothetical protein
MNTNRRQLIKRGLLSFPAIYLGITQFPFKSLITKATELLDKNIKKQGYVHDVFKNRPTEKKFERHLKKLSKLTAETADHKILPACLNCKHYKKPENDWGLCAMVGANKKNNLRVYKNGWCKVWSINKKIVKKA